MHEQARFRFFFHPRNQKDFFLNLLTSTQREASILAQADNTLQNVFSTLGSGDVHLGETIHWQRDFKSGKVWDLKPPFQLDIMDLGNPSDVKVPWELSRFHQVWWLGKAYWLTRNERYAEKFAELVEDWITHNPPGLGVNWANAMEPSIRATNLLAGYFLFCESKTIPEEFWLGFFKSLYVHGVFVRSHLEYSWRSGNHLLSDLVGLIALGIFFRDTPFGKNWLRLGTTEIESEIIRQVHADGVDYEKSTSYQRLVVELLATAAVLCRKNGIPLSRPFWERLEHMVEFVQYYVRPDGTIPLFGDADDGRLFRFVADDDINDHRHVLSVGAVLFERADFKDASGKFYQDALWLFGAEGFEKYQTLKSEKRMLGSRAFREGGFYIMRGDDVHVTIDAGDIGMGGLGGHGHNDTLSFEYWVRGSPLIVDSGTYAYTSDAATRQELRSTKSHNTVMVDGKELATFVGLWMILSDATRPRVLNWTTSPSEDSLEAAQYAYRSGAHPIVHTRRISLNKAHRFLNIEDVLEGTGSHTFESRLHFAPGVELDLRNDQEAIATYRNERYIVRSDVGKFDASETWYSRSYGVREKKKTLRLLLKAVAPVTIHISIGQQDTHS
jgi:uncharacterized heparinase superfamily protein